MIPAFLIQSLFLFLGEWHAGMELAKIALDRADTLS